MIEGCDVDVYAHGWWHESYKEKVIAFESTKTFDEDKEASDVFNYTYRPVRSKFEPQIDFSKFMSRYEISKNHCGIENELFVKKAIFTQLSSLYNIMMADQIIGPDRSKYDIIARVRTDLQFKQKIK